MIILHGFHRSTATFRVRIALNLKGVEYQYVEHDLVRGEHQQEPYLKINPQGLVPALEVHGVILTQSLAIIEYLNEVFPHCPLLPSDPGARAKTRSLYQMIAADTHPLTTKRTSHFLQTRHAADARQIQQWQHYWLGQTFNAIEVILAGNTRGTKYACADEPTLADIALVPQVYAARRLGLNTGPWPNLTRVVDNGMAQPAFIRAHPDSHSPPPD